MKILRKDTDLNILLNTETDFQTNLGWEENLKEFETEILSDIINPIENYETVRYIHKPYTSSGVTQTDIWFYFYFLNTGGTYVQDYYTGDDEKSITYTENEQMLKQSTQSFFRLEFFKTPGTVSGTTLICEPPTRQNRKLIFAKNLSLPLGEKMFYNPLNGYIHLPVFRGSNYSNKENMYFFWFQDESVLTETNLSGTTTLDKYTFVNTGTAKTTSFLDSNNSLTNINIPTGTTVFSGQTNQMFNMPGVTVTYDRNFYPGTNTFFMTAKFYNAKDGTILDFTNDSYSTGYTITEQNDMYYQVDINKTDYSYQVYFYNGVVKCEEVGLTNRPIMFFEKGGGTAPTNILYHICSNVTPTPTPTITPTSVTPTPTSTHTPTPTPTQTQTPSGSSSGLPPTKDWYTLENCWDQTTGYTTGLTIGTYVVNNRVTTFLDIGTIWKVIAISSNDPAPLESKISVAPSLDYFSAIQNGCPPIFEYFLSDPYDATTTTPFCSSPGKSTGTYIKTFAPTILNLYDYPVYDYSGSLFEGAGNDYNYFITTSSGVNSYTSGSVPLSNNRLLIKIDNSSGTGAGKVVDISSTTCVGGGGGIDYHY